jgi:ribonuclease HI
MMVAFVDGGSRGNPGPSGIGVVIKLPTGRKIEISEWIGSRDNNYAEYAALLVALAYAAACGAQRLQVYSDSQVVVRQISGLYTCQSPGLKPIHDLCQELIRALEHFTIIHIRRHYNAEANRLAHAAIERAQRNKKLRLPAPLRHSFLEVAMAHAQGRICLLQPPGWQGSGVGAEALVTA